MSLSNAEIVQRVFNLAKAGDVEGYAAHVDPDAMLHPLVGDRVFRGPDGLREYFRELAGSDTTVDASPFRFEERGDAVLVPGRIRVRSGGSLTDSPVFWIFKLRDGAIVRTESYGTEEEAEAALGGDG